MQFRDTNYKVSRDGTVVNILTGRAITPVLKPTGYKDIRLQIDCKQRSYSHHRLVYEAWNGMIPQGMQINHINGVRIDNHLDNLELVTPADNQLKRLNLRKGESVNTAKLTDKIVKMIKASSTPSTKLASEFGVHRSTVNRIRSGKAWKHIN